jgi:hypothetical protein
MDLAERNRLIAVTKGFQQLRGLIYAPAGILNVAISLDRLNPHSSLATVGIIALFLCATAAMFAANWYYRRRFGVVRPRHRVLNAVLMTVGAIVGLVTMVGAWCLDASPRMAPVSFMCLWWALFYVACYLHPYAVRPHSLWFAALFLGFCVLTQMGVVPKSQFFLGPGRAGEILIWLAFSLHGLLDHLLLLRLLPKASLEPATAQATEQHD